MSVEKCSEFALRDLVAAVAGPRQWSDTRQSWLARAGRRAKINYRTVKALFYNEITDPHHPSAKRLRDAAAELGYSEAQDLAQRFETMARALDAADEDFHRADCAALIDAARALRGLSRARNDQDS